MRFGRKNYGESLRDYLNQKPVDPPSQALRKTTQCEVAGCRCDDQGGADIAIHDHSGTPLFYCCQRGYLERLIYLGKDQLSQVKESEIKVVKVLQESSKIDPQKEQPSPFTSIVQSNEQIFPSYDDDFERYADSYIPNDYDFYDYDNL